LLENVGRTWITPTIITTTTTSKGTKASDSILSISNLTQQITLTPTTNKNYYIGKELHSLGKYEFPVTTIKKRDHPFSTIFFYIMNNLKNAF